jgi:hypothetical protein
MAATVYISSHSFAEAGQIAGELRSRGIEVVSTWHDEEPVEGGRGEPPTSRAYWEPKAQANVDAITRAGVFLLVAGPDKYAGGKFVEAGYALRDGAVVFVLGRPENGMIGGLADEFFSTLEEVIEHINRR